MVNPAYPNQAPGQPQQGNGIAVAGLVLGLLSLLLFWLTWPGTILGILGIIFGALGRGKGKRVGKGAGMGTAGLILGLLGTILSIVWIVFIVAAVSRGSKDFERQMDKDMKEMQKEADKQLEEMKKEAPAPTPGSAQ